MASSTMISSPDVPLLRIKRLRTEDLVDALLIHQSCKRQKVQFDYVGTRMDPEPKDLILQSDVKSLTTCVSKNSKDSRRKTKNVQSSQSRYEFVSKNRGNLFCDIVKMEGDENEDTILCNGIPLEEKKEEYVYDFYHTTVPQKEFDLDYVTSVYAQDIFVVEMDSSDDECNPGSDDSNDENNYRNDYPDEEDEDFYQEEGSGGEDCYGLLTKLNIDDEFYSGDEDGHLYSREMSDDESRNGLSYARYKQSIAEEDDD